MRLDKQRDTLLTGRGTAGPRFVDGYLAYLLAQASQRISAEFHLQVKAAGLSVTEWRVLASLEGSPGETIGTLAVLAITKQPTLSKVVQRMEADGLVARTGVRADRRQTRVCITAKGTHLIAALCEQALQHQKAVLAPFGEEKAALLIQMLDVLMTEHVPLELPIDTDD
ncbi:MarR family winged helix-turn-helix transcriptional regulator [Achromobacter seleniivolatilans]|uniref:MarR family winged helix-turn-helix transcriptional regulator n=1 Tax=Achromobacter seleniivolatilans TaxID=3047478 RepID=A0ABY9LWN4_9BURK|nr:MarR family winged helix-turn-helix transcriptional regulator [Achromobacter sp. R39]WMD18388.1 MarR family winged helix-turn-helix transcriptional regulator [Achromobacter sp. R39]